MAKRKKAAEGKAQAPRVSPEAPQMVAFGHSVEDVVDLAGCYVRELAYAVARYRSERDQFRTLPYESGASGDPCVEASLERRASVVRQERREMRERIADLAGFSTEFAGALMVVFTRNARSDARRDEGAMILFRCLEVARMAHEIVPGAEAHTPSMKSDADRESCELPDLDARLNNLLAAGVILVSMLQRAVGVPGRPGWVSAREPVRVPE